MKRILLATNTFGKYVRQDLAVESMKRLVEKHDNVEMCLIQFAGEGLTPYTDVPQDFCLRRSSADVLDTTKKMPFMNDIFDFAADIAKQKGCEIFVVNNSDIILSSRFIKLINNTEVEAFGVSRIDISEITKLEEPAVCHRMEPAGFDSWVVSVEWWAKHRHLFHDLLMGRPEFDIIFTSLMLLNSENHHISTDSLVYHMAHENTSFTRDACYQFNIDQRDNLYGPLIQWWGSVCNATYLKRRDFGSFLMFNDNEHEIIEELVQKGRKQPELAHYIV